MGLSRKDKIIYGTGAFGYGSVNQMLGNFLMFFGTGVLGLSGTLMGIAISVSTIWDAVTDPIVGSLSDNYNGRHGKRHYFMFMGCIVVALINIIIWNINPEWTQMQKFFALLISLLIIETFNTVYSTPYSALGMDMGKNYNERTSIQGYKTVFQFLSLLVPSMLMAAVLSPKDYATMSMQANGYKIIAIITSALCIFSGLATIIGTKKYKLVDAKKNYIRKRVQYKEVVSSFFGVLKCKNNVFLISAYAVSLSCSAFITTLGMHIFTYTFHFSTLQIPIIMGCLVLGIILGQPFWYMVSKKIGKRNSVLVALSVIVVGTLIFSFILASRFYIDKNLLLILVCINITILSWGLGCVYSLPISMFADNIKEENTAMSTGFLTFCSKFTNAGVMVVIGVLLDIIGFRGGVASQSIFVSTALGFVLILGVIVTAIFAWILYDKYQDKRTDFQL